MRIVCDTHMIVSGMLFGGHPRDILTAIAQGSIDAFTTPALLTELRMVLLRRKFRLSLGQVDAAMELVRESFVCVDPRVRLSVIADDPDDDRGLEAALASRSRMIVSGDKHLLNLHTWRMITVLSPAAFATVYL